MLKPRLFVFMLILALAGGCARWERPEPDRPKDWIGVGERELVLAVGAPDAIHALGNGSRILTWRRHRVERRGGDTYTATETRMVDGKAVMVPVTRQEPVVEVRHDCTATFEIDNEGFVSEHRIQGNDCDDFLR